MTASRCRYLELYDPDTDGLSEWGRRVWGQMGSVNVTRLYSKLDRPRSAIVDAFWSRHDGRAEASLTESQIIALEAWLEEKEIAKGCPHEPYGETGRCLFHLAPEKRRQMGVSDANLRDMFLRQVVGGAGAGEKDGEAPATGRGVKCFVGTRWEELDLRYEVLASPDNHPIDLRMARIGCLNLDHATIEQPLRLDRSRIREASFRDADFLWSVSFRHARFLGDAVNFERTRFAGAEADFSCAQFRGCRICFDHVTFDSARTSFSRAEFGPDDIDVDGEVSFYRSRFSGGDADFTLARFGKRVLVEGAPDGGKGKGARDEEDEEYECQEIDANLDRAVFSGGDADFGAAEFFGNASFKLAEFTGGYANFSEAQLFGPETTFQEADFGRSEVDFSWARFQCDSVDFSEVRADAADLLFKDTRSSEAPIDMSGSELGSGVFRVPEDEATVYDLEGARLGSVELESASGLRMFDCFRLLDTDFDGFDFSRYNDDLADTNWEIHGTTEPGELEEREGIERELSPGELEATYMKAKIGASRTGHTKATAEFFQKELLFRRDKHLTRILESSRSVGDRLRSIWHWVANSLLWWVTGYGERPFRVIGASIAVIVFFVGAFHVGWTAIAEAPPSSYQGVLGSLLLSFESFTTLVLGGGNVETQVIRLIGYVEGFIGAFLIALFVFTITRSIRR